jgi:hypothetical protein
LVKIRRCAWAPENYSESDGAVWARNSIVSRRCPKSIVTPQSVFFLEQFRWWKELGGNVWSMEAKSADAVLLLEQEWRTEMQNGKA